MKASERRQAILEVLCERRYDKIENLAFEFSVNECTIRRDILELSLSHPIYTKTGKYDGGVYVADGYYLGKQYLSEKQRSTLEELCLQVGDDQRKVIESVLLKFGRPNKIFGGKK